MRSLIINPGGKNWLQTDHCGPSELIRHAELFPEILSLKISELDEITLGAYIWKFKILLADHYKKTGMHIQTIVYEKLLNDPETILKTALNRIGLPWDKNLLAHEQFHKEKKYIGNTMGSNPIMKSKLIQTYNLKKHDYMIINSICHNEMRRYGYRERA